MPFHTLYSVTAEVYSLVKAFISPAFCMFGWLILSRAAAKHLHSYVYWFLPSMIGTTLSTVGILVDLFLNYLALRDYALITASYFLFLAAIPFHIVSVVRLWKTISGLPAFSGELPQQDIAAQDAGVWPPAPRR